MEINFHRTNFMVFMFVAKLSKYYWIYQLLMNQLFIHYSFINQMFFTVMFITWIIAITTVGRMKKRSTKRIYCGSCTNLEENNVMMQSVVNTVLSNDNKILYLAYITWAFFHSCSVLCAYIRTGNAVFSDPSGPRRLRRRSAAARLLGSWVRVPPGAWIVSLVSVCVVR
jgi:hypothetical protein